MQTFSSRFFPRDPFRDKTGAAGPGRSIAVHPTRRLSLRSLRQRQPIALLKCTSVDLYVQRYIALRSASIAPSSLERQRGQPLGLGLTPSA